jgi:hypothetical protein
MSLKIACLSVFQPWAELLVAGIKPVENRTKRFHHRGSLLIHASKKFDANWIDKLPPAALHDAKEYLKTVCSFPTKLPRGCIVGSVIQVRCADPDELMGEWHEDGAFGLIMACAVKFKQPIPYVGRQGMFKADMQGKIGPADIMKMVCALKKWREKNNGYTHRMV